MADCWDEQFRQRCGMHCLVCDPISAEMISALNRYIEREQITAVALRAELQLAEKKLAEFDQVWDGEKYCFTPKPLAELPNSCNRHSDCTAADEKARAKGYFGADHCHDDCCEDCFGS